MYDLLRIDALMQARRAQSAMTAAEREVVDLREALAASQVTICLADAMRLLRQASPQPHEHRVASCPIVSAHSPSAPGICNSAVLAVRVV